MNLIKQFTEIIFIVDDFALIFKALRKKTGLTQAEFGKKIGVSGSAVSEYEKGKSRPDTDRLPLIAKELGVTVDKLLSGESSAGEIQAITESQDAISLNERLQYELRIKELELEMERKVNTLQKEIIALKEKELKQQQQEIERQRSLRPDQDAINK